MKVFHITILIKKRFGYFIIAANDIDQAIDMTTTFLKEQTDEMAILPIIGEVKGCNPTVTEPTILINNAGYAIGN